jgi:RNA polymerase sigma-70 factor (ECF subfamily)
VVNRAIDWTRARALRREVGDAPIAALAAVEQPENPHARTLASALASLSPEHRAVIVLRHLLEYTPGEIAELLGLPRGTVNSRLRRGLDALERMLGEDLR